MTETAEIYFLTVVEDRVQVKVLADLVSGESSLPGFPTTAFLLCPHVTFPRANLMTSGNLSSFFRGSIFTYSHTGVKASTGAFGENINIQSIAASFFYSC